jgi:hypothetical protein
MNNTTGPARLRQLLADAGEEFRAQYPAFEGPVIPVLILGGGFEVSASHLGEPIDGRDPAIWFRIGQPGKKSSTYHRYADVVGARFAGKDRVTA